VKRETLNVRMSAETKELLQQLADRNHVTMTTQLERMIREEASTPTIRQQLADIKRLVAKR
jgi:predicted transcriptional regulator